MSTIDYRELADIARRIPTYDQGSPQYVAACRELAEKMGSGHRDELRNLVRNGPVWDGDVLSKSGRDWMLNWGLASKCLVKGEEGYQVATYRGGAVLRAWEDIEKPARRRLLIPVVPDGDVNPDNVLTLGSTVNMTSFSRPHLKVVELLVNTVRRLQGLSPLDLKTWKPEKPDSMLLAFAVPGVPPCPIRLHSEGKHLVVSVEVEKGAWVPVIRELVDSGEHAVSHIVERGGVTYPTPAAGGDR